MKKVISLLTGLIISTLILAQAPESFTYQAIVRDNSGQPLPNTSVTFQFNILQTSTSGTLVYSEEQTATTNGFGLANLNIGQGTVQSGTFSTIDWSNDAYFLNIQMDMGSGFVDLGAQQLVSVPYALYAKSSGSSGITNATGNNGDVQFNDNGILGANPDLHWDDTNKKFIVGQSTDDGRMIIQQDANAPDTIPILEVKNKTGQTIFVVYPDSVHVFIDDSGTKGALKGGFAVSGRSGTKALTNDFLLVRPDSTRIWTTDTIAGFGVRSLGGSTETTYMQLNPNNYFIGHNSGHLVTTGLYNCTFGFKADSSLQSGSSNIIIGYEAGKNNMWGSENVFMGYQSGYSNSVGGQNVFIGYQSGFSYTGQFGAVCIGQGAGKNCTGPNNVIIGRNAGSNSTSGSNNVFVGAGAGGSYTGGNSVVVGTNAGSGSGGWNTFLGCNVGANNTTGAYNLFAGWRSGNANTTGTHNIFLGYYSGHSTQKGDYNTFLGDNSGYSNVSGAGNVFLGYQAGYYETGSNKLYVENSNSSSPLIYGEFDNNILELNANQVWINHATGSTTNGLIINNTGNSNHWSLYQNPTSDLYLLYNGSSRGSWNQTTGAYTALSDKRLKKNFEDMTDILPKIEKMNPMRYNFKTQNDGDQKYMGFIAQDIKDLFPSLVSYNKESDIYMIDYAGFSVVAIQAIKEQQKLIKELTKRIEKLENKSN